MKRRIRELEPQPWILLRLGYLITRSSARSLPTVLHLSALFALDAFGGGFTMLTFLSFYFHERWSLELAALGAVLAAVNVVAGLSGMAAGYMVCAATRVCVIVRPRTFLVCTRG